MVEDDVRAVRKTACIETFARSLLADSYAHIAHDEVRCARCRGAVVVEFDAVARCSLEEYGLVALEDQIDCRLMTPATSNTTIRLG